MSADAWTVRCDDCGAILEAGRGRADLEWPRIQLPCPECDSLFRSLHEAWDEEDGLGQPVSAEEWPAFVAPRAVAGLVLGGPDALSARDDTDDDFDEPEPMLLGLGFRSGPVWRKLGDPSVPVDERDPRAPHRAPRRALSYQKYLEESLSSATGATWRASAPDSTDAGGMGIDPGYDDLVRLVIDAIPTLANLAGAASFLAGAWKLLKRLTGSPPFVDEQSAAAMAAAELIKRGVDASASLAFATTIDGLPPEDYMTQGYAVGFRLNDFMWFAVVTVHGGVLGVCSVPHDGRLLRNQPSSKHWLGPELDKRRASKDRKADAKPSNAKGKGARGTKRSLRSG